MAVEDRKAMTYRLDRGLCDRLDAAAGERNVSTNWLVERLLAESLDRLLPAVELRLTRPSLPWSPVRATFHRLPGWNAAAEPGVLRVPRLWAETAGWEDGDILTSDGLEGVKVEVVD